MPTPNDRWFEAVARVDARDADSVADAMQTAGADGVSIEPAIRVSDSADFQYDELTDQPWTVRGTFAAPFGAAGRRRVGIAIRALSLAAPVGRIEYREADAVNWAEEWKKFYRIQHIGRRLVVRPSWEPYTARTGEVVVDLDPGAAFGTGEHETTRLCLAAVEAYLCTNDAVLDVGAGSGILAIAAQMLGAGLVHAVDLDGDTIEVARENAARNAVSDTIAFATGSLGDLWPWPNRAPDGRYDLVLANISSLVIERLAHELASAVHPGGLLAASGFILRDVDEVAGFLASAGLLEVERTFEGNWGCIVSRRP